MEIVNARKTDTKQIRRFLFCSMFCSLHLCDRNQFIGVHMFEDYLYSAKLMYIQVNLKVVASEVYHVLRG